LERFCRDGQANYPRRTDMPMLLFLKDSGRMTIGRAVSAKEPVTCWKVRCVTTAPHPMAACVTRAPIRSCSDEAVYSLAEEPVSFAKGLTLGRKHYRNGSMGSPHLCRHVSG
jgi:hypothetical protein